MIINYLNKEFFIRMLPIVGCIRPQFSLFSIFPFIRHKLFLAQSKMESTQRIFVMLSLLPSNEGMKSRRILFGFVVFLLKVLLLITSLMFFCRYLHDNLADALYALLQISVFASASYTSVVAFKQRQQIQELFIKFKAIQSECKFSSILKFSKLILCHIPRSICIYNCGRTSW